MDGLIAEHISKTYAGAHGLSFAALRDVSIHLEPGSFTSLVGESGSGKSTLARLLVGLEPPDQGTISLDGEDTSGWSTEDWRKRRTTLQAVFQDASGTLNPMRSVRSNVEEAMVNLTSLSKRQRRERIGKLMELTHMEERLLEVPARQLSGGEQRRLSLVRAMSILSLIHIYHVSFAYKQEDGEVLHDVNLDIRPGTVTALVGPSGSGKSTIAKLIAGFWDVTGGSVALGGVDLRKIPLEQLNRQIAYVSQDNYCLLYTSFQGAAKFRCGYPLYR